MTVNKDVIASHGFVNGASLPSQHKQINASLLSNFRSNYNLFERILLDAIHGQKKSTKNVPFLRLDKPWPLS